MLKLMVVIAVAAGIVGAAGPAAGQPLALPDPPPSHILRSVGGWVAGGAAGGFGLGFTLGMGAFDGAINAEKKIWTSAVVGAVVGGAAGYLVGRARRSSSHMPTLRNAFTDEQSTLISQSLAAQVAKSVTLVSRPVVGSACGTTDGTPAQR